MESHPCFVNFCCYADQCHNAGSGLRCPKVAESNRLFCKYCIKDGLAESQLKNELAFQQGKTWKKEHGRIVY